MVPDTPPSRASPFPQGFVCWLNGVIRNRDANPAGSAGRPRADPDACPCRRGTGGSGTRRPVPGRRRGTGRQGFPVQARWSNKSTAPAPATPAAGFRWPPRLHGFSGPGSRCPWRATVNKSVYFSTVPFSPFPNPSPFPSFSSTANPMVDSR